MFEVVRENLLSSYYVLVTVQNSSEYHFICNHNQSYVIFIIYYGHLIDKTQKK
jgi:hypothetical protein